MPAEALEAEVASSLRFLHVRSSASSSPASRETRLLEKDVPQSS
jgi:hypothetical protein